MDYTPGSISPSEIAPLVSSYPDVLRGGLAMACGCGTKKMPKSKSAAKPVKKK